MANAHDSQTLASRDATSMARDAKETLKQEGQRLAEDVKAKAGGLAAEQKDAASSYLNDISTAIHDLTSTLDKQGHGTIAHYTRSAADELQRMGQAIGNRDFNDLAREVTEFAQRRPALFFGGAFAIGFGLARFLASSKPERADSGSDPQAWATEAPTTSAAYREEMTSHG
ncbi:MAG: hypothetical protein ACXW25_02090 [Rhodospirillales bacterium]